MRYKPRLSPGFLGIVLSLAYLLLVSLNYGFEIDRIRALDPNNLGDFLAGVFGPVAVLWLVLGFFQQGKELNNSVRALTLQAEQQAELARSSHEAASFESERRLLDLELMASQLRVEIETTQRTLSWKLHEADRIKKGVLSLRGHSNSGQMTAWKDDFQALEVKLATAFIAYNELANSQPERSIANVSKAIPVLMGVRTSVFEVLDRVNHEIESDLLSRQLYWQEQNALNSRPPRTSSYPPINSNR